MLTSIPTIAFVPREVFSTTRRSLETLYARTAEPFNLVCVDGNSPEDVAEYLRGAAREKGFTLLRSNRYLTPNQARNVAADWALSRTASEDVVFVDNDVLVSPGWLGALQRCARETGAGIVGPAYFEHLPERTKVHLFGGECRITADAQGRRAYHEKHHLQHTPIDSIDEPLKRHETELIEFHTVLVRRSVFDRVGMLDEGFMSNIEHGDLCLTARQAGFSIWMEPEAQITYAPPRRLDPADREFFFLRWSEAWTVASERRLQEKYGLADPTGTKGGGLAWVRDHRRLGLQTPRLLRRMLGRKLGRSVEKRLIKPLEWRINRHRFPLAEFSEPAPLEVVALHQPPAARLAA